MSKFKVGDRVRPIKSKFIQIKEHWDTWWSYEQGVSIDGSFLVIDIGLSDGRFKYSNSPYGNGPFGDLDDFELVTETLQPSFVKFIPEQVIPARRELLAGSVQTTSCGAVVDFTPRGEFVQIDTSGQYFSSEDIRELITYLTTIAEILEENAK